MHTKQDSVKLKPIEKAEQLFKANNFKSLLEFSNTEIPKALKKEQRDSLEIAKLYQYQGKAYYQFENWLECIKSDKKGILFCNNTEAGKLLKGKLYSDKATAENYLGKDRNGYNSTLNSIKLLSSLKNPDYDYLITSYRYLSEYCAAHGYFEDAKTYLRQAENIYKKNKKVLDRSRMSADGENDRYEPILLYSKIYQLYKNGKSKQDSLDIEETIAKFEKLHSAAGFSKKIESIYYTAALNHVGDWYTTKKSEALTTEKDLEKAHYYLDKSIGFTENKGYKGSVVTYKYNKAKALILSNNIEQADVLMSEILEPLSEADGRKPFFFSQQALIRAKQNRKKEALVLFYKAVEKVHSDSTKLTEDFKNFKPSTTFSHTRLLLKIAKELDVNFPKDTNVKKIVAELYAMSFEQFEHSYDKRKYNKTQKNYLRQIIQGLLGTKRFGYNKELKHENILNRFENIQSLLAWQKFNQNRQINNFPELDSLQFRNYNLLSLIASAKTESKTSIQDSLQTLLSQTEKYTKETIPNLGLFNGVNFNVDDLKSQLKQNQLILKYLVLDDELAIYTITKNQVTVTLKPWYKTLEDKINQLVFQLKTQDFNNQKANEVAEILLPKIENHINHIIINPDEVLNKLAFEVLPVNNKSLIESFNIGYTSNLQFISPKIIQKDHANNLAIYAPEYPKSNVELAIRSKPAFLEGAQKESELISELFSSNLYNGKHLTKQDFIKTASNYKLLHLAMHAEVNNNQPTISRLLFSDENSKTDDLFLEELYGLNLNADLAVLSACNTGVDNSAANVNIESFQRAFTFAGVPATIASLWEVPDLPTKEIMVSFYKNLKDGQSKSLALKNAKLSYKNAHKNTKLSQPYYWAGFVLYGEDKAVVSANPNLVWYVLLVSGIVIIFMVVFRKSRQNNAV